MKLSIYIILLACLAGLPQSSFSQSDTPAENKVLDWMRENIRIFDESGSFSKGTVAIGLGYGFKNNIGISNNTNKFQVPALPFHFEVASKYNIGVGLSGGVFRWRPKESNTGLQYGYYTLSPRIAYHLNLGQRLDLYSGMAINTRLGIANNSSDSSPLTRMDADVGVFGGLRYYLLNGMGIFLEHGIDNVSCSKAGLVFRFN